MRRERRRVGGGKYRVTGGDAGAAAAGTGGPLAAPIWAEGKGGRVKGDGGRGTGGHGFDDVDGSQVVAAHLLLEDAHVLQSFHT